MKTSARSRPTAALLVALVLLAAGCGSGSGGSSRGGGGGRASEVPTSTSATSDARQAPTLAEAERAKGTVTFCVGQDTSASQRAAADAFNARYARRGIRLRMLELPGSADDQRTQFIRRQRARSGECDIFSSDVVWTAELASQRWLLDMSDYVNQRRPEFIGSTLSTVRYDGRYWGVPQQTDAALLYRRSDKVPELPSTWQDVYQAAREQGGIVYPGAADEGLTCSFLEVAFAAGGTVLSEDGKTSEINSPENLKALQLMVDGVRTGAAPKAVTTYTEEQSRRAFESGGPAFMRDWLSAYVLDRQAPEVKGKVKSAPLPSFDGGGTSGVLGGRNLVISAFSKNPEAAVFAVHYLTSPQVIRTDATRFSLAPVLEATYDDPAVQKALPFAAQLKRAVSRARKRPVSPVYPQISQAIYQNVNAALSGRLSPQDALDQADEQIRRALARR
jgi:multiple sugar transport system substrate-binding protein